MNYREQHNRQLVWRGPLWFYGLIAWLLAGPLNPAGFVFQIMAKDQLQPVTLTAIPCAIGVAIVLWRILGRDITLGKLAASVTFWAFWTIPLYMGIVAAVIMGAQGFEDSFVQMLAQAGSGLFIGIAASAIFGWIGLLFAIPAGFAAFIVIRIVALKQAT